MPKWCGTYVINWKGNVSLSSMPRCYNLILMFVGLFQNNQLTFSSPTTSDDYRQAIAQGRRIVLSLGGATNRFDFTNRSVSDKFIADFQRINSSLGNPFTGIDLDENEGSTSINTQEYIYVCQKLQQIYGNDFHIFYPSASWDTSNLALSKALVSAGIKNFYAGPQWYDGPGLNDPANVMSQFSNWASQIGQERMMIGLGLRDGPNYWTAQSAAGCVNQVMSKYPNMAGIYDWEYVYDKANGNQFANIVAPVLGQLASTPIPIATPTQTPVSDSTWTFLQGQDYWDGVSNDQQLQGQSVDQIKAWCANNPQIVAFNTNGYVKTKVGTSMPEPTFTRADQGLYVKKVTTPVVTTPVTTPVVTTPATQPDITGTATINGYNYSFKMTFSR